MNEAPSKEIIVAFFKAAEAGDVPALRDSLELYPMLAEWRDTPEGPTALIIAAKYGNAEAAQILVDAGADIRAEWGCMRALSHAAYNGHYEACKVLVNAGADPHEGTMQATACAVAGDFPSLAGSLEDMAHAHRDSVRAAWRDAGDAPIYTARPVNVMKLSLKPKI